MGRGENSELGTSCKLAPAEGGRKLILNYMLQATLYIPEEEENFHIDIYEENGKSYQIAEVFVKNEKVVVNLYNNPNDTYKELDLEELLIVLQKSFDKLKQE